MPYYDYKCPSCTLMIETFFPVEDYVPNIECTCGAIANRVFGTPQVTVYPAASELLDKALRGEVEGPGMSKEQTRKVAHSMKPERFS